MILGETVLNIVVVKNLGCPKQGPKLPGDILLRVDILAFFFPKQAKVFIPLAALLHLNIGPVLPPTSPLMGQLLTAFLNATVVG